MSDKDTIYRQDAIKTIKDADVFVAYHEKDPIDEAVDEAIRATKRSVIYDIGILPSAEPESIRINLNESIKVKLTD